MGTQGGHPGSAMQRARLEAGYSLAEAATAVTRDPQSVRRWERNQAQAPQAALQRLARLYGVQPSQLVSPPPVPGFAETAAYLRARRADDLDAQAAVLTAVVDGGLPAVAALAANLAHLLVLGVDDVPALLDRVEAQLVSG
ncbi:helix-turn-helix domain-containing protein [Nocardioides donggukensis]|uniref:Helix-turn-helix transcriptional regulator n=1 Tax=Nocardioides donggukensis TaxID=2774019 RepID=A0A927PZK3_9ACTN|nr:helix-turn-helix transcriptional regulator [Nocardioides donggukensis]MBD8869295.1 helix-turn-helix transcriptional regulator [Nocardioides donggukensis]